MSFSQSSRENVLAQTVEEKLREGVRASEKGIRAIVHLGKEEKSAEDEVLERLFWYIQNPLQIHLNNQSL